VLIRARNTFLRRRGQGERRAEDQRKEFHPMNISPVRRGDVAT
jgi:hypothetical protein